MENYGVKLDLTRFRDGILFLNAIGIHTKHDMVDQVDAADHTEIIVHTNGRRELFDNDMFPLTPDRVQSGARFYASPSIVIYNNTEKSFVYYECPLVLVRLIAELKELYKWKVSRKVYIEEGSDKLIDCCYLHEVMNSRFGELET